MEGDIFLEGFVQEEIDQLLRLRFMLSALKNAYEFDLAEAASVANDNGRGGILQRFLGKIDFSRWAAGVANDNGPVTI